MDDRGGGSSSRGQWTNERYEKTAGTRALGASASAARRQRAMRFLAGRRFPWFFSGVLSGGEEVVFIRGVITPPTRWRPRPPRLRRARRRSRRPRAAAGAMRFAATIVVVAAASAAASSSRRAATAGRNSTSPATPWGATTPPSEPARRRCDASSRTSPSASCKGSSRASGTTAGSRRRRRGGTARCSARTTRTCGTRWSTCRSGTATSGSQVRSISHWSPYDRVRVVNAVP
eukprot:31161-Pelagococcus_subviridis.AAC.5